MIHSLSRYLEDLLPDTAAPTPNDALALAGLSFALQQETNVAAAHGNGGADVGSPWNDTALSGFRIARPTATTVTIMDGDVPTQVRAPLVTNCPSSVRTLQGSAGLVGWLQVYHQRDCTTKASSSPFHSG